MAIVRQLRNRYFFTLDDVLLITAVVLSYVSRLETFAFNQLGYGFLFFAGVVIVVIPLLFYLFGIYSRVTRVMQPLQELLPDFHLVESGQAVAASATASALADLSAEAIQRIDSTSTQP